MLLVNLLEGGHTIAILRICSPVGDNRKRNRDSKVHRMHMFMCGVACEAANGDEFMAWKIMSGAQSVTDWSVSFSGTITSISHHKKFKFFIVTGLQTLKKLRVLKVIRHLPNPFSFGPWHFGSRSLSCGGSCLTTGVQEDVVNIQSGRKRKTSSSKSLLHTTVKQIITVWRRFIIPTSRDVYTFINVADGQHPVWICVFVSFSTIHTHFQSSTNVSSWPFFFFLSRLTAARTMYSERVKDLRAFCVVVQWSRTKTKCGHLGERG